MSGEDVSQDRDAPRVAPGSPVKLAAVVLAAGAATRMGRPKALLEWRGRTFLRHVVALAEAAGADPIAVVEGATALPTSELGLAFKVVNETWSEGQTSSLVRGLAALAARAPDRGVLVLSVDRPHVRADTVAALAAAFRAAPAHVWQPGYHGRRGHPIIYPVNVIPDLLQLGDGRTPRDVLARPAVTALRRTLELDDPAVLDNLDRPEDLARLP